MTTAKTGVDTQLKSVLIIGLGGTISLSLDNGRAQATDNLSHVLAELPDIPQGMSLSTRSFLTKDSVDLTLTDMLELANLIATENHRHHAFVVTTGTDTMEEVSYSLQLLLADLCPIVVTGAMRPPYLPDYDGHRNLLDALVACAAFREHQGGTFVAMAGLLIAAPYALKTSVSRMDAFISTSEVYPRQPIFADMEIVGPPLSPARGTLADMARLDVPNIDLLSASLGSRIRLNNSDLPDGIVVSCPGAHSISTQMLEDLSLMFVTGRPVVLASRCVQSRGSCNDVYPGYDNALEHRGVLISDFRGLSPQKARVKLAFQCWCEQTNESARRTQDLQFDK